MNILLNPVVGGRRVWYKLVWYKLNIHDDQWRQTYARLRFSWMARLLYHNVTLFFYSNKIAAMLTRNWTFWMFMPSPSNKINLNDVITEPEHNEMCLRSAWASAQSDQSRLGALWVAMNREASRLWSDWPDAKPDLSLRRVHRSFC